MDTKEEKTAQYPALEKCMIVESRFLVRQEIVNSIKSSSLFDNVLEAQSLSDGIEKIKTINLDACFVGSSVTPNNAESFLGKAAKASISEDCSFIVVVNEENKEAAKYISNAHGVIDWPCNRENFTKGVIKSVVKANNNSPWKNLLDLSNEEKTAAEVSLEHRKYDPKVVALIFASCAEELRKIGTSIRRKEYGLDKAGYPDIRAKKDIDNFVNQLVIKFENPEKAEKLKEFFQRTLSRWVINQIRLSPQEARIILEKDWSTFPE